MSLLPFTITTLLISIPWLYFFPPPLSTQNIRPLVNLFLLLHTIYILYFIVVWPPQNIFSHLGIPLSTPTDTIRSFILKNAPRHQALEQLVTRMGSFETRTFYIRFGHNVVATCEHCHSFNDFATYALPSFLLAYIKEAAVIGVVTIRGTGRERYRAIAIGVLIAAALAEMYWVATVHVRIPSDTTLGSKPNEGVIMWHDRLTLCHNIFFILFPLAVHFILPPSRPTFRFHPGAGPQQQKVEVNNLQAALQINTLQSLINKLQLLKYTRGAIIRTPELNASSQEYWRQERREGEWVRNDATVQSLARKTGYGFDPLYTDGEQQNTAPPGEEDPSKLRRFVRNALNGISNAFAPSDFWKPPSPTQTQRPTTNGSSQ